MSRLRNITWWGGLAVLFCGFLIGCTQLGEPASTPELQADLKSGAFMYSRTCAPGHGRTGQGIPNLGKDLPTSQFVQSLSDEELVQFILVGRTINDPANTTGIAMPPKGDNEALTPSQIGDIVAYIRTLPK